MLEDGRAPGGPAVLDHPAFDRGTMGGIDPVTPRFKRDTITYSGIGTLPQGSAHLRAGQTGAVQVEGLLMELPGMGSGTCPMLPFHKAKLGAEGRLGVRMVRLVRHPPHSLREVPSLAEGGESRPYGRDRGE